MTTETFATREEAWVRKGELEAEGRKAQVFFLPFPGFWQVETEAA